METTYRIEDNKLIITTVETKETVISLDDVNFEKEKLNGELSRYESIIATAEQTKAELEEAIAKYNKYTEVIKGEKALEDVGLITKK